MVLKPNLPGWLFDKQGSVTYKFLGYCMVIYHNHNPARRDTFGDGAVEPRRVALELGEGKTAKLDGSVIRSPYAAMVRAGQVKTIHVFLDEAK